ncbi:MAG: TonB-dependent receptor, partial [Chitinophagaceae bacterium]|nr:TonB-dependent receptor [Chitinophagaceae bacterium]
YLKNSLDKNSLLLTSGENDFNRLLTMNSIDLTQGHLLVAAEKQTYNGPWVDIREAVNKTSAIVRYISNINDGEFTSTLMAYKNQWNSADQIPDRAVKQNLIDKLGSLDDSVGGSSSRYSLSANWHNNDWLLNGYIIRSSLDLYSNFTYFLDDPIHGDQFEQVDARNIYGAKVKHQGQYEVLGKKITHETGAEFRQDDIGNVGLYHTYRRKRLNTTREDSVNENSIGLFQNVSILLNEKITTTIGGRYDYYRATVSSNLFENSGTADQGNFSLKAAISYRITEHIEGYLNAGQGFHSNDARGATITQDPITGEKVNNVNLLVPSTGSELGIKLFNAEHANISISIWHLRSASELVFVGDAGTTEASRSSERYGHEIAGYYWIDNHWSFDAELAWTHSSFTENEATEGKYVEGSVPFVGSFGINYGSHDDGFHSAIHYRYFGARQLDSFNAQNANPTKTVNFGIGYAWKTISLNLDILNLLNSTDHDIDYYYTSRLKNELEQGTEDLHYHPVEPRTFRIKSELRF